MDNHKQPLTGPRVFWLGVLFACLALSPAILPYGGRYVTRGDFIEQQLPFLREAVRILRAGPAAYSFSTFLGAPALGSYAFYTLGSPFVWPLALLPEAALPYGISIMAVFKLACALCFAFLWLRRLLPDARAALLAALLYAFSSFTVVNTQFYHFWEVIAFFPLILLGMEDAMGDTPHPGRLGLFCALSTLTNYYFMFASAMLSGLYFLFRLGAPAWRGKARRIPTVLAECALGCALAGVLLVPALLHMLTITRTGGGVDLWAMRFRPAELLERLRALLMPIESGVVHAWYGDAGSWTSAACALPVFGWTGVLAFLRRPGEERWLRHLLVLMLVLSFIPQLSGAFALWTNPAYLRWWYGLAAMQALAVGCALCDERGALCLEKAARFLPEFALTGALVALLVLPGLLPRGAAQALPEPLSSWILNRRMGAYASPAFRAFSVGATLLGAGAFLWIALKRPRFSSALAMVAVVSCLQFAGYIALGDALLASGGEAPGRGPYTLRQIAEPSLTSRSGVWRRIDYGGKLRNYGLLLGASSLRSFQSLRSATVGRFVTAAGFGYDESTTVAPPDSSAAIRALLGVTEYHRTDPTDPVPEGFVYAREENGFPVYENPNAVPMGFLQTEIVRTREARLRREILPQTLLSFAVLDDAAYDRAAQSLSAGDAQNPGSWAQEVKRLQSQACTAFAVGPSGFTARIDAPSAGLVVFTIPYDKGFSARVDGAVQEILPCDLSFMGVLVSPGAHEIEFVYRTRGLRAGMLLSFAGAIGLAGLCVLQRRRRKARE